MKIWITPLSDLDDHREYDKFSGEEFSLELFKEMLSLDRPLVFGLVEDQDLKRGVYPTEAVVGDLSISHPIDW